MAARSEYIDCAIRQTAFPMLQHQSSHESAKPERSNRFFRGNHFTDPKRIRDTCQEIREVFMSNQRQLFIHIESPGRARSAFPAEGL